MEEIAVVYARSLFEAALDADKLDVVREQLGAVRRRARRRPRAAGVLLLALLLDEEKKDGLHRAVDGAEPMFMNFLELLLENHRMPAIFRIRRNYDRLWEAHNRLLPVEVTSAVELDEETVRHDRRPDRRADRPQGRAVRERASRTSSAASSSASATRCSTPPSATAWRPFASRSSGPSRRDFQGANESHHADQA